jgi:pimeloyl-ACP methyl ester carboxylesterase
MRAPPRTAPPRPRRRAGALGLLALGLGTACAQATGPVRPPGHLLEDVVFTEYSPLSRNVEIARRMLTPLTFRAVERELARGQGLRDQPVDLAEERFAVYVPGGAPPPSGYGLLVYIAPWEEATKVQRWRPPLDRHGLIFVSAARSGNETSKLDRRVPLAVLAYHNVRARFPIDPRRVFVGGFSGGARAAQAAALAYPDVFRAALLNAGSDPIGRTGNYLPPSELFRAFQGTRLVYATGDQDEVNLDDDRISRASMQAWCVLDVGIEVARRHGHQPLDAGALDRALDALERHAPIDPGELARCNARVEAGLAPRLRAAEAALARRDRAGALAELKAVDARYGGLAAGPLLDLAERIEALPP